MSNSNFQQHLNNHQQQPQQQSSAPRSSSFNSNLELLKNEMVLEIFRHFVNFFQKYIFSLT